MLSMTPPMDRPPTPPDTADILLVEDQASDAELARRALKEVGLEGRLVLLRNGKQALDYMFAQGAFSHRSAEDVPQLILLDLKLPRVSGIEVLEQLKADPRTRTVPVIMLTSSGESQDVKRCYALGANSYVVKPVDYESFVSTVRQLGTYWLHINESQHTH